MLQDGGYARFRPADVGKRCGLSNGLVFKYFPTKLDLVAAALERSLSEHFSRLVQAVQDLPVSLVQRRTVMSKMWDVLSHPELRWTYELYAASAHDAVLHAKLRDVIMRHGSTVDTFAEDYIRAYWSR